MSSPAFHTVVRAGFLYWRQMAEVLETQSCGPTVGAALASLARHPVRALVVQWNWKSALLSAIIRGFIFLLATMKRGWWDISTAVAVEAVFSALVSGVYGSFTQALRFARPEWLSRIIFAFLLPAGLLALDCLVHYFTGMRRLTISLIMSGVFSTLSSLFNLYIMRRGALLTGGEGDTLGRDMARMPRLLGGFLLAGPQWFWARMSATLRRGLQIAN